MNLPDYERVIYQYNPLIEVVAQLRFPTILRISNQQPVDFQDQIRHQYPGFEVVQDLQIPPEMSNIFSQLNYSFNNDMTYQFKSEDLNWQLSLNQNYITLATTKYERYEQFMDRFKKTIEIFDNIYNPSYYSRIGLRYRDLIIRSKLDILDKQWEELIPDYIAGELHRPEIASSIKNFVKNIQLETDFGQVIFNHGLVKVRDTQQNLNEDAYLLDADFFTEGKIARGENVWKIFDKSNAKARNLFRWSITEELHRAMQPQRI